MRLYLLNLFLINIFISVIAISDDCTKLNEFLGKTNKECCNTENIKCGDGYITRLELGKFDLSDDLDFNEFPIFPKLIEINLGSSRISPSGVLPNRFFEEPMLTILTIYEANITSISTDFNKNSPILEINLEHNQINEFPYQLKNLPNLQHMYLWDNKIPGTINLKGFKTLKHLDISGNEIDDIINIPKELTSLHMFDNPQIKKIPDEVLNLAYLEELNIGNIGITELPPDVFKLKLNYFKIDNNPQLTAKLINFGNGSVKECGLQGTNIECYEKDTCSNADINLNNISECTTTEIDEIKSQQSKRKLGETPSNKVKLFGIIFGSIAGVLIIALLILFIWRKFKKNDDDKEYDIVVKERIKKIKVDDNGNDISEDNDNEISGNNSLSTKVNNSQLNNVELQADITNISGNGDLQSNISNVNRRSTGVTNTSNFNIADTIFKILLIIVITMMIIYHHHILLLTYIVILNIQMLSYHWINKIKKSLE
eukprot:jgi/Orpsp1_1/1181125/evm.model.c7180000075964.1